MSTKIDKILRINVYLDTVTGQIMRVYDPYVLMSLFKKFNTIVVYIDPLNKDKYLFTKKQSQEALIPFSGESAFILKISSLI